MHKIQNQCLSVKGGCWVCAELLVTVLVGQGLKQASLGQYIFKAMKSNSVIPFLLFGLTIEIDHTTEHYQRKFQSWDVLSPMMKVSNITFRIDED